MSAFGSDLGGSGSPWLTLCKPQGAPVLQRQCQHEGYEALADQRNSLGYSGVHVAILLDVLNVGALAERVQNIGGQDTYSVGEHEVRQTA